jgi:hypothetical protein
MSGRKREELLGVPREVTPVDRKALASRSLLLWVEEPWRKQEATIV